VETTTLFGGKEKVMRLVKFIGSKIVRVSLLGCGAMVLLTAFGSVARAGGGPFGGTPEIDPSSLSGAITLLFGGALLLSGKRSLK
jgi:hypothetical protein